MLVLTRKQGEQIRVGDNICVTVLAIEGNRVRLGLTAPADVSILRVELVSSRNPPNEGHLLDAERLAQKQSLVNGAVVYNPHG
jgi:carbon storage regulator